MHNASEQVTLLERLLFREGSARILSRRNVGRNVRADLLFLHQTQSTHQSAHAASRTKTVRCACVLWLASSRGWSKLYPHSTSTTRSFKRQNIYWPPSLHILRVARAAVRIQWTAPAVGAVVAPALPYRVGEQQMHHADGTLAHRQRAHVLQALGLRLDAQVFGQVRYDEPGATRVGQPERARQLVRQQHGVAVQQRLRRRGGGTGWRVRKGGGGSGAQAGRGCSRGAWAGAAAAGLRSEERRVGKECRL